MAPSLDPPGSLTRELRQLQNTPDRPARAVPQDCRPTHCPQPAALPPSLRAEQMALPQIDPDGKPHLPQHVAS